MKAGRREGMLRWELASSLLKLADAQPKLATTQPLLLSNLCPM